MVICNTSGKFVIAATEMYVFFLIFVIGIFACACYSLGAVRG